LWVLRNPIGVTPGSGLPHGPPSTSLTARGHFVLFVALLLLPLLAFATWLATQYVSSERARLEQSVQSTAQQIAAEVDRDLSEMLAALYTLSTSRLIADRDFAAFHRQMADARTYVGADILLRSADGQKIADTREPFGAPLGVLNLPRDQEVLERKAPVVSGVFIDNASRATRYSIILPIVQDGKVAYFLNYTIPTTRLVPYLKRDQAEIVSAAITDRNGVIVARSSRHEELSGSPGNAAFIAAATGRAGIWPGANQDDLPVIVGYYRSPLSGWLVSSSIAQTSLSAPLYASLRAFATFGLIALALSLVLALLFGRRIATPLGQLARGAMALGHGEKVTLPRSGVREIDDVSQALEVAAMELHDREAELVRVQQIGKVGGLEVDLRDGFRNRRSPEYLRIHGLAPDATHETHEQWVQRIHPDDRVEVEEHFRHVVKSGAGDYAAEYRIVRPNDGEVRWISAKAEIERDAAGLPLRLIGAHTDVTEIKQAEDALQALNESLEAQVEERTMQISQLQKLEAIGQLTGGIAHDFNNLLTVILGNLELLKRRLPQEPRYLRLIDNAVKGTERGSALTQRLLAFARRQELRPEAVDVERLVQGMTELLQRSLGPLIEIDTQLPPQLHAAMVDANQLELAILNLAVNGRDAMPKGGKLTIAARDAHVGPYGSDGLEAGEFVVVTVQDAGEGMDETTLRRATEPFFTTKGLGKGTGLGLSMVHGLAAQSGGILRLISRVGEGTSAELWLPRAATPALPAVPETPEIAAEGISRTVLVVDDDPLVLAGTTDMLEDLRHTVVSASSARQALEILRAGAAIDIVVTDHAMPAMTGTQLAAEIRRQWPSLPVIIATGYAELPEGSEIDIPRIAKPFGQQTLVTAIEAALRAATDSTVVAFRRS
jgi:PAS domain S-box-containing protein